MWVKMAFELKVHYKSLLRSIKFYDRLFKLYFWYIPCRTQWYISGWTQWYISGWTQQYTFDWTQQYISGWTHWNISG